MNITGFVKRVEIRLFLDMLATQSSNHHCSVWRHEYREWAELEGREAERSNEAVLLCVMLQPDIS